MYVLVRVCKYIIYLFRVLSDELIVVSIHAECTSHPSRFRLASSAFRELASPLSSLRAHVPLLHLPLGMKFFGRVLSGSCPGLPLTALL